MIQSPLGFLLPPLTIVRALRKGIDEAENKFEDAGTGDFLNGLMQNHEKMAWKLRKYFKD